MMMLSLSTIPLLLGQIVPLPGGLGVREAAMVALAVPVGMSSGELLGFAILQRVLLVVALPVALLAVRVARRIDAGMVGVNRALVSDPAAPFGGMKQSGLGREGAEEGVREFLEQQYLAIEL